MEKAIARSQIAATVQDELNRGLAHHQGGRLREAAVIYEAILARHPNHADALHLLGVAALQVGNAGRAAELIGRAISLRPDIAIFHCHLALVRRAQGRPDQAAASCRTALQLQPGYADAANNLGLALQELGQVEEAVASFRAAIRLQPDLAMAHNNLGNALRQQGDVDQAMASFRQAVRADGNLAEAHTNLGQLLLEQRDLDAALQHCNKAVRLCPTMPQAHNNLGNVLREHGRLDQARACYAEALRLRPDLGMTSNNMAQALQEEGQLDEAVQWYRQALRLAPDVPRIHVNLASALAEQERDEEATCAYQEALRLDPSCAEAYNGLGLLMQDQGRQDYAAQYYREAVRFGPTLGAPHCNFGNLHEELGDFDAAQQCYRESLRNDPGNALALSQLATMLRGKLPADDVAQMQRLLGDPHLRVAHKANLHFGLAQVHDAHGDYRQAAAHLRLANSLSSAERRRRGQDYDPALHTCFVDDLIGSFTPDFFERTRGFGLHTEQPIFIVGLPRSGTTLVEQILASHSQVFGAGELSLAREDLEALPAVTGRGPSMGECLSGLTPHETRTLAQRHLEGLKKLAGEKTKAGPMRIVDKMPDNYLHLGLLATLFPRAKFIHCRRGLRDVAVSCWMTNFKSIRWAQAAEHIARRFADYRRVVAHWQPLLPVPVLDVNYEDTVANLEDTARKLVDWCGLAWEPQCLAFHKTKRAVKTASTTQVRQPIYKHSVARWKNYEAELGELFAALPDQ